MHAVFIGSFYPENRIEEIRENSISGMQNAANNLQMALLEGLSFYYPDLMVITVPAISSYPKGYRDVVFNKSIFSYNKHSLGFTVGFLNIPLVKHISKAFSLKNKLCELKIKEDTVIFIYSIHSPFLFAIRNLKKKHPTLKVCLIVPDLPQFMSENKKVSHLFLKKIDSLFINNYLEYVDSFVLLSNSMKKFINIGKRPYTQVEGIMSLNNNDPNKYAKENLKTVLYSGTLSKRYGIVNLIEAFNQIESKNYRLWICGDGNTRDFIIKCSKKDSRIKYFGVLPTSEVLKLQKKATVLVNPRTSSGEFTKYSFPSKTMEYLASGTPTILYRMEGIPEEYYKYCFVTENENPLGLKKIIIQVCEKSQIELNDFGKRAHEFILNNKNPKAQVKKIVKMINLIL